ncbi:Imm8 family immunity protein [Paenibacillus sp. P13VS]|uniref:Imm8 family immunity protein n=1 Tax=Paenibacillus sp. P13VS TaxID=2697367 RepID=UPI00187BA2D6|nr:Imm8 family immunity protein [Paenibacillus sp. P13VS]MBE7680130.1 hypothetical protein [Paenibacillus sp. P13VS]
MSEEWVDLEEFYVCLDAFIGEVGSKGSEVFRFYIVSPKWLLRALESSDEIELGRGYLIGSAYNISKVEYRIKTLLGNVEVQEHIPIEVAILAAFLFYRYKFLSRAKDKNLYRLPEWTRT